HCGPGLQSEERLVFRFHNEWTETVQRSPDGDGRENKNAGGRFALREAESGPDHDRAADEGEWIIMDRQRIPTAKNELREHKEQQQKNADFDGIASAPTPLRLRAPKQNERG